ncbi:hypothetical protein [Bradyrhizobium sp.]|uniref:hypothetical protein n=1 Tax=Bradyrhizobium sp. TaxID=376 RepID=UPI003C6EB61F
MAENMIPSALFPIKGSIKDNNIKALTEASIEFGLGHLTSWFDDFGGGKFAPRVVN